MPQLNNFKIQNNFNKSAQHYDLYTQLHRDIADKVCSRLMREEMPTAILDVGCGTGYLTRKLKDLMPQVEIVGLDFAQGMLEVARLKREDIFWVLGDCKKIGLTDQSFDWVVSNLAYQWSDDLTEAFSEARRVLNSKGIFACTLFGYKTCQELFQSLNEAKGHDLNFSRLPQESSVRELLAKCDFKNVDIHTQVMKMEFKDIYALLNWLKSIGANNISRIGFIGTDLLRKADLIFQDKFSYLQGVGVSFEVIYVYAKK